MNIDALRHLSDEWLAASQTAYEQGDEDKARALWGCAKELRDLLDSDAV
jgi:hypothetical protein